MKADPRTEAEVMHVLSRVVELASRGDVDGAIALFVDDPDVFLLGTGVDEARTGRTAIREQIERDFTQSDALSWILSPQSISAAGSVAWTSGDVVIRATMGGQTLDIPHRLTTVLERRGGGWLFQQIHLSFANGAQVVGQSFPTNLEAVADAFGRERVDLQARVAPDGTVTLLFTDVEGSTQMAEQLGDLRWLALLREHNAIVRAQIAQYGGFEVKTIGDAFMVAFGSARRALLCAISIQQEISRYGADHAEHAVRVRIGLHAGEPVREGNDFHGQSVIFASRIAGEASGGEILVSRLLRELTESAGDIRFDAGREVVLKGLTGTHAVYPVRLV
jgi:class 3 adenylate cyclase/ketosteroid isomerase-like protein